MFWNRDLPYSLNTSEVHYRPTPPPWLNPPISGTSSGSQDQPAKGLDNSDLNSSPPHRNNYPSEPFPMGVPPPPEESPVTVTPDVNTVWASITGTIVIFVGISFLLVNMCAFIGLYYQRDKLKVRERIVNSRYRCVNANPEEDDVEDHYMKNESQPALEGSRDLKNIEIKSILKSSEGIYEQVKTGSNKTASVGKTGRKMGISRQASSSTVTIDPHTKVKEWIAQEVIQRCSPRFMRRTKRQDPKAGSCDTYADGFDQISTKTIDSNTSKIGSLNGLHKQKVKKVSVAIDATPATRSASILQQTPIELTKSMDEGLVLSAFSQSPQSLKAATSLMTILKRPSLQRSDALSSDESISDRVEPLRRSTSINLKLSTASDTMPSIAHVHSKSDPVTTSESTAALVNIRISPEKQACDVLYSQVQKRPKLALPVQMTPMRDKTDINVTSRDDLTRESEMSVEEALDSIKRRNCPKVLPDYPDEEDFHLQKATKRRSLPLSAQISTDPGGGEDSVLRSDSLHALKVPPPPPPRVSTLGRKPTNNIPVSPLTSQLTVRLKPTSKSQVPVAVRSPQVPVLTSPIRPACSPSEAGPSQTQVKRLEPRVIIKPTMNPITSQKDSKPNSNIPRVTPPQPVIFEAPKNLNQRPGPSTTSTPTKLQDVGMGRKTKITPVKKTVSTETAMDSSASNTGTIKRLNK